MGKTGRGQGSKGNPATNSIRTLKNSLVLKDVPMIRLLLLNEPLPLRWQRQKQMRVRWQPQLQSQLAILNPLKSECATKRRSNQT